MSRTHPAQMISMPVSGTRRGGWFFRLSQVLGLWQQRRNLATLDDATLSDIGLTRSEAMSEAQRPLWDVPANWLR